MATDDTKVQKYIDIALKNHSGKQRVSQLHNAWLELVAQRRAGCSTEENLVQRNIIYMPGTGWPAANIRSLR